MDPGHDLVDFAADVGAAVVAQDIVVEIFDAQAETGDADCADRFQFGFGQGARLAFEGDLGGVVPRQGGLESVCQRAEVAGADIGGRAAAEVDKVQRSVRDGGQMRIVLDFARQGVEIGLDLVGVLVGIDAEIAELATLAAEGNVEVEAEPGAGARGPGEDLARCGQILLAPKRIGRIVGDEDAADAGFAAIGAGGRRVVARRVVRFDHIYTTGPLLQSSRSHRRWCR